jgi:NADH dehydrogenase/NADH:ubiquinone oxidoreductase subunit G
LFIIDNIVYKKKIEEVPLTIFQFCIDQKINIPCFCYNEELSIAGNCRMCVVEVEGALVVSCATPLMDNMIIFTDNKRLRKVRESILEFLLVNHPLDCPICDEGGECDLQDISVIYGSDHGRYYEIEKRSVDNLNCCGPLIKTIMTRCIHCTRCVRFVDEILGNINLGMSGRGNDIEISVYIERNINDELIGNIIDNIVYKKKIEEVPLTIFQFCIDQKINIPCFCYNEELSIAGNCRMCVVEVEGALVVSCATPLMENMNIYTDKTPLIAKWTSIPRSIYSIP